MKMRVDGWTPTEEHITIGMHFKGYKSGEIALVIKKTRNAVLGKIDRWKQKNPGETVVLRDDWREGWHRVVSPKLSDIPIANYPKESHLCHAENCGRTHQPGRALCAEHIRARFPKRPPPRFEDHPEAAGVW